MAISFSDVPSGLRTPFVAVEFDDSRALQGPSLMPHEVLCIGQRTSAGTQAELQPFVATTADQVRKKAGAGSQAHLMAKALFNNNRITKTTFVLQDDSGSGTNHTKTITMVGTTTEAGGFAVYIGGYRVQVAVASGDNQTAIASAIDAAITLIEDEIPFTSGASAGVVTLTAKNAGTVANDIDVRVNYYAGEELPAGFTVAIATGITGANDPDISDVWPVLGDTHYTVWAVGHNDAANIGLLNTELDDRAGSLRSQGAVVLLGKSDTHANLLTFGSGVNNKRTSYCGAYLSPSPTYEWAAAAAGAVVESTRNDPARPLQTLPLKGILPPAEADRFTLVERDLLLNDGIATHTVSADGTVRIERQITSFQTNEAGAPSTAFLDIETPLTLEYLRYDFRVQILNKYPRHKLAADGTKFGAGQAILTPKLGRAEAINIARGWETIGLVEGIDQFVEDLIVERNLSDPNRLDFLLPPDLVNGARVFGVQIGFLL
jgi:phage tail sheath gpL-like